MSHPKLRFYFFWNIIFHISICIISLDHENLFIIFDGYTDNPYFSNFSDPVSLHKILKFKNLCLLVVFLQYGGFFFPHIFQRFLHLRLSILYSIFTGFYTMERSLTQETSAVPRPYWTVVISAISMGPVLLLFYQFYLFNRYFP